MDIKYLGHASFLLRSRSAKVVTDPFSPDAVGLKFPKVEADVVTVSHGHADHNASKLIGGNPLVISLPGEYEKNQVRVAGYKTYHDGKKGADRGENTIYMIEIEDVRVLHLGDLGHLLDDDLLEEIDGVDILLVPVGGFYTINPEEAAKLVSKIEASVVIPMHYQTDKLKSELADKLASVSEFLGKIDASGATSVDRFSVKKSELSEEETKVVVMES